MGNLCLRAYPDNTTFKWRIDNFPSLHGMGEGCTYSRVFRIWGHDWSLKLNPVDRTRYDEEFVSLSLELSEPSMEPNTIVDTYFILMMSIHDQSEKHIERRVRHIFHNRCTSSSKSFMIKLAALNGPYGLFDNNSCIFGVKFIDVISKKAKSTSMVPSFGEFNEDITTIANTTSETLLVKYTSTLPEAEAYTWCIADFFGMENPGYSPEFTAGGYKWSIRLDKKENHISLYLKKMTDDLPEDYAVLVELTLSVINQEGLEHWKQRARLQFSNDVRCWGWEKPVSMDDMHDSLADGYLIKTKCCIKAEVKIVGSSIVK